MLYITKTFFLCWIKMSCFYSEGLISISVSEMNSVYSWSAHSALSLISTGCEDLNEYRFFILFISIFFFPVLYCSNLVYWQQRGSCNWVGLSLVHIFYTFSILYILQQVEEQCVLIKAWKEPLFGSEHLDRVISVVQTLPPSLPPSPSFLYLSIFFNLNSSLLLHPSLLVCVQTNDTQAWESALSLKRKERKVRKVFVVKAMLVVIS